MKSLLELKRLIGRKNLEVKNENLIVIGIGGSYLGGQAVIERLQFILRNYKRQKNGQ